tara:strand:+ start:89 stop:349 length:261 start_codon:yes stop_codon:yes gene_type:complete
MIKYILIAIIVSGCSSHIDVLIKQHQQSLSSVKVGNSYVDMLRKVGHKPTDYTCEADLCIASYRMHHETKEVRSFIFSDDVIVRID